MMAFEAAHIAPVVTQGIDEETAGAPAGGDFGAAAVGDQVALPVETFAGH